MNSLDIKGNSCPYVLFVFLLAFTTYIVYFNVSLSLGYETVEASLYKRYIINDSSYIVTNQCPLCNFTIDNQNFTANSSKRDLIVAVAFNKVHNLYAFVRTARTTGFKGRIVIFINDKAIASKPPSYFELIKNCGVQFINYGVYLPSDLKDVMYFRFEIVAQLLEENKEIIDRVIMCDIYDAFFQHDPFTTNFSKDEIIFGGYDCEMDAWNLKYAKQCFDRLKYIDPKLNITEDDYLIPLKKHDPLNGGVYIGGIEPMIKILKYMSNIGNPFTKEAYAGDQGCLNLFYHIGAFKDLFPYRYDHPNNGLVASWTVYTCMRTDVFQGQSVGNFHIKNGKSPAIFHQFDRSPHVIKKVINACPVTNPPSNDGPLLKWDRIKNRFN